MQHSPLISRGKASAKLHHEDFGLQSIHPLDTKVGGKLTSDQERCLVWVHGDHTHMQPDNTMILIRGQLASQLTPKECTEGIQRTDVQIAS